MKLSLFLNHACNLRCTYCYNGDKFSRAMPLETAKKGVDLALDNQGECEFFTQISFFGGEPLLEMELIRQITAYAKEEAQKRDRRLRFVMVTNGSLLSAKRLDFFMENRAYLGISLDGCREAHDATRPFSDGKSSYDKVVANLKRLVERNIVGMKVIAVVDPRNVDFMGRSLDSLLELGVRNISMNINYEGSWTEEDRQRFEVALRQLGDRYVAAYERSEMFRLNLLDSKIITHLKQGYSAGDRCDFGCEEVCVAPSGRLYPCDRLVGEDTREDVIIGDVWHGLDPLRRDALIEQKNSVLDDCGDCVLLHRCMHWCGCVNHAMTGSVGQVDGLLCWFEQRIIEEADRCAAILFKKENQAFLQRFYAQRR